MASSWLGVVAYKEMANGTRLASDDTMRDVAKRLPTERLKEPPVASFIFASI
jgi:hypothetical protein